MKKAELQQCESVDLLSQLGGVFGVLDFKAKFEVIGLGSGYDPNATL